MQLLSELRKEQMQSRDPASHVFRITKAQEEEIIESAQGVVNPSLAWGKPVHISTLFGCKVEIAD